VATVKVRTDNEGKTKALARAFAARLAAGDIVALIGDLGAGKTTFVQGLAEGLGIDGPVTSPTFALVNQYSGRLPLYHFDVYRLDHPSQLEDIGYEEYFYGDGVSVIEWANLIESYLPDDIITISFRKLGAGSEREIEIAGPERVVKDLAVEGL